MTRTRILEEPNIHRLTGFRKLSRNVDTFTPVFDHSGITPRAKE